MTQSGCSITIYNTVAGGLWLIFKTDTGKETGPCLHKPLQKGDTMTIYLDQGDYQGIFTDGDSIYPQIDVFDGGHNFVPPADQHVIYDTSNPTIPTYKASGGIYNVSVELLG